MTLKKQTACNRNSPRLMSYNYSSLSRFLFDCYCIWVDCTVLSSSLSDRVMFHPQTASKCPCRHGSFLIVLMQLCMSNIEDMAWSTHTCCHFIKLNLSYFVKIQFRGYFVKLNFHQIFCPYGIVCIFC